jgi:hypothetical protein
MTLKVNDAFNYAQYLTMYFLSDRQRPLSVLDKKSGKSQGKSIKQRTAIERAVIAYIVFIMSWGTCCP